MTPWLSNGELVAVTIGATIGSLGYLSGAPLLANFAATFLVTLLSLEAMR